MAEVTRVVDAHVHLWDPARTEWYPFLSGGQELNMGDISGMVRKFDDHDLFRRVGEVARGEVRARRGRVPALHRGRDPRT